MTQLGDKLLVAYSDDELSEGQADAISNVLLSDPETAQRLEALKTTHQRLRATFHAMLQANEACNFDQFEADLAAGASRTETQAARAASQGEQSPAAPAIYWHASMMKWIKRPP